MLTPENSRQRSLIRALVTTVGVFLLALVVFQSLVLLQAREKQHAERQRVLEKVTTLRSRLDTELSATLYLANGLVAFIQSVDNPTPDQYRRALKALFDADSRVRNIGLAPDNRLAYVYPLEGNEKAIGLRFRDIPEQWPSVQRAMQSRNSVVVGPVDLVQGGRGIINRTPVFLSNGDYWGLISIVVDIDRLFDYVGISARIEGTRYWLLGDAGDDGAPARMLGQGEIPPDAITMSINLPGATWELLAAPQQGWYPRPGDVWPWQAAGAVLALLIASVVWLLIRASQRNIRMAAGMRRLNDELVMKNAELTQLSRHDGLTGLANRRHFDDAYAAAWARARRQGHAIFVLIIDFDHFKSINDRYGHVAGDSCLIAGAAAIRRAVGRMEDLVARSGGEEFAVVLENLDASAVSVVAERIRAGIEATEIEAFGTDEPVALTASIGVAGTVPDESISATDLYREADAALYRAKRDGRNRVRWAERRG